MAMSLSDKLNLDKFIVKKPKSFSIGNIFQICDEGDKELFDARSRRGFHLVEQYDFFESNSQRNEPILTIKREKFFQLRFIYCLFDSKGLLIAKIKVFWASLKIHILNADDIVVGKLEWVGTKIFRSYLTWFGSIDIDIYFQDYKVGTCIAEGIFSPKIVVDLTSDSKRLCDRRIALGLALALLLS